MVSFKENQSNRTQNMTSKIGKNTVQSCYSEFYLNIFAKSCSNSKVFLGVNLKLLIYNEKSRVKKSPATVSHLDWPENYVIE